MDALAGYLRPWNKRARARDIAVETAPVRSGGKARARVIARIPRTDDISADHALADIIIAAFELAEAAGDLIRDGHTDSFGQFTYSAPPRGRMDAVRRLQEVLSSSPPPRSRGAAFAG